MYLECHRIDNTKIDFFLHCRKFKNGIRKIAYLRDKKPCLNPKLQITDTTIN
jgi:hypothetical protein